MMQKTIGETYKMSIGAPDFFYQRQYGMNIRARDYPHFARRFWEMVITSGAPQTQEELGRWFGFSGNTAWMWKNGRQLPSMSNAVMAAEKLGCCVEWLLTGRGPQYPESPSKSGPLSIYAQLSPRNRAVSMAMMRSLLETQDADLPPDNVTDILRPT